VTHLVNDYLPARIERALKTLLSTDELIDVKLQGAFKEALVCTDRRVLIVKGGYMTGQIFGTNAFQIPYANIAGVEVKFHLITGYFELSAGGMQNTAQRSYWSQQPSFNAAHATNCVSLNSRGQAAKFREACSFILKRQEEQRRNVIAGLSQTPDSPAKSREQTMNLLLDLGNLREKGIITEDEFNAKKSELLSRI
jgi:hypothetical protein